jgi:hypothetical protein
MTVNQVVEPLGEHEELGLAAAHHRPLRGHTQLPQQRHDLREHLGHPPAPGGRVDHPDLPALQTRHQHRRLLSEEPDRLREMHDLGVVREAQGLVDFDGLDHAVTSPGDVFGRRRVRVE